MKRIKILFVFCVFVHALYAQVNLVPNPGFEIYDTCPYAASQITFAKGWFSPNTATPDYFHSCASPTTFVSVPINGFGNSFAHTGNGMAGFFAFDIFTDNTYREYIATKLKNQLSANTRYFVSFYVRLPDSVRYASNRLFAYLGDSLSRATYDTISVTPQISTFNPAFYSNKFNWVKVKGSFTAQGNEKFLYIGYFKHPFSNDTLFVGGGSASQDYFSSYYYVDNVCVTSDSVYNEEWLGVGLGEMHNNDLLKAYPSIITDILYFNDFSLIESCKILDTNGETQLVIERNRALDFTSMKSGLYFVIIRTKNKEVLIIKVIKD